MPVITTDTQGKQVYSPTDNNDWRKTLRRPLWNGEPLSGKTTALTTLPAPRHILTVPGELGHSSIEETEGQKKYYWEFDANNVNYKLLWSQVQQTTKDILSGKFGEVKSFAIDSLHVLYYLIQKAHNFTVDSDAKEYSRYHEAFRNFLIPIVGGPTPYVGATCYDGVEAVEFGSKTTALFPQLPGIMAKGILGIFPLVIHTKRSGLGANEQYFWELQATGTMRGVGVHVPLRIKQKLPPFCEPKWDVFEKLLLDSSEPVIKQLVK